MNEQLTKKSSPRVCHVMLAKTFGGGNRLCVDLCLKLHAIGIDVMCICQPDTQAYKMLEEGGILCVPIKTLGWWDPVAPRRIRRIVEEHNVDIVHSHLSKATYLAGKARLSVPLIASVHNYKLNFYKNVDHYVPITYSGIRILRDSGVEDSRIHFIHNFSSMEAVSEMPASGNNIPHIVAYGRFVTHKGFHILLRALGSLKREGLDFRLTLGGAGPSYKRLLKVINEENLGERVEFCGWINDVKGFLDKADLFVLPSFIELFPLVILEAMARGIPIVSTRTEGPREFLSEETAYLCNIDDIDSLSCAIKSALIHPSSRRKKAENALRIYKERFTAEAVAPDFISLYKKLNVRA